MQQKPKTAAEYQAEMMQLYRRAHPVQETIAESSPTPTGTNVAAAPTTPTATLQTVPDLPPACDTTTVPAPESPIMVPDTMPPERTETPDETTSEASTTVPEAIPPEQTETETPEEPMLEPPIPSMNPATPAPEIPPASPVPTETFPSLLPEEQTPVMELEPVPTIRPNTAYGFLKVITRTGSEAMPLPNVTVTVTAMDGANSRLYFSGVTNESGETDHIPLPAPELMPDASSTNRQLYQNYDVVVYHPDYFRMESRGLPIFPGITSLQKFAMIPLPQRPGNNPPTVVYENTEPKYPD